jgi:Bacterial TSP3 repeat
LASIITFYYLETKKNLDSLNTPSSSSSKSTNKVNTIPTLSTGKDTPATKSIKNTEQKTTKEWLSKNFKAFGSTTLDQNNDCVKTTVCSNDSDPDNDGLKNIYEFQFGTDPNFPDTDRDGLGDGDELLVYYTDPTNKDSTSNGVSDSDKLITCKNLIEPIDSGSLSQNYLLGLSERVSLYPLHTETQKTLQNAGGTIFDLQNNGYIKSVCDSLK